MMKNFLGFVFSLILFCSFSTFANFSTVEKAFCDGKEVPVAEGLRVFVDFQKLIFGIGTNENSSGKICKIVDFYLILITAQGATNNNQITYFEPVEGIGRRNSCEPDISNFEGPNFKVASLNANKIIFKDMKNCKTLEYELSIQ